MSAERSIDEVLQEQIAYYRARAGEYDEWFYRQGRWDHGRDLNRVWFDEVMLIAEALGRFGMEGEVLELACGTGIWTTLLARRAARLTALDASPEALQINRMKLNNPTIRYVQADVFAWRPDREYDAVFFSFWLSHVPPERLSGFLRTVHAALRPQGKVFIIDSLYEPSSTASDHRLPGPGCTRMIRRLNDGREFEIVKVFYEPDGLRAEFERAGFDVSVETSGRYFLYGFGHRR